MSICNECGLAHTALVEAALHKAATAVKNNTDRLMKEIEFLTKEVHDWRAGVHAANARIASLEDTLTRVESRDRILTGEVETLRANLVRSEATNGVRPG